MNRMIKLLIVSDIFVITGFGLIEPILAIFIKESLIGGSIFAAGVASTIFLLVKSAATLPISGYVDKHGGKTRFLVIGTLLIAIVPFIYLFSIHIVHIYFASVVSGLGAALAYPTWCALFSLNLDKGKETFEWGFYDTLVGAGAALSATLGAATAELFGFQITFLFVGALSLIGCFILFYLDKTNRIKEDRRKYKLLRKLRKIRRIRQ